MYMHIIYYCWSSSAAEVHAHVVHVYIFMYIRKPPEWCGWSQGRRTIINIDFWTMMQVVMGHQNRCKTLIGIDGSTKPGTQAQAHTYMHIHTHNFIYVLSHTHTHATPRLTFPCLRVESQFVSLMTWLKSWSSRVVMADGMKIWAA